MKTTILQYKYLIPLYALIRTEFVRIKRIWMQTLLPPIITVSLYFIVFGQLIGAKIGTMSGINYIDYIAPGLIMMTIINNSYTNVVSSFYSARFQHSIEEVLISSTPNILILVGYACGGIMRGILVGTLVSLIAIIFTHLTISHAFLGIVVVILSSMLFSFAGFLNGMLARSFDDTAIIPTFIIVPLTYLGGIFYSIDILPNTLKQISYFNPILYMVNALRYSFIDTSDVSITLALIILCSSCIFLLTLNLILLKKGIGLRS